MDQPDWESATRTLSAKENLNSIILENQVKNSMEIDSINHNLNNLNKQIVNIQQLEKH